MNTGTLTQSKMKQEAGRTESGALSPVDNRTYNLLQALVSKLEALDAYSSYASDDGSGIFGELMDEDRRQAQRLLDELRGALCSSGPPATP
jgi:hypothetical protein